MSILTDEQSRKRASGEDLTYTTLQVKDTNIDESTTDQKEYQFNYTDYEVQKTSEKPTWLRDYCAVPIPHLNMDCQLLLLLLLL